MNFLKLLESLAAPLDKKSEEHDIHASRRESLQKIKWFSKDLAVAALPLGLMTLLPSKANAGITGVAGLSASNDTVTDVLNFALTLEYLEREFYTMGVGSGIISSADTAIFNTILQHEVAHVSLLIDTINALGGTPVALPVFDFTAGGMFTPFSDYAQFRALSQAFEDTGVRAYKGQAGNLLGTDLLTVALQIHSVEARHASEVRRLRKNLGDDPDSKGWIIGQSFGTLPAVTAGIYAGENNVTHGGVDATTVTTVSAAFIMEAFDEPLTKDATLAIAGLFL